jgi:hypothetical protein
MTYEFSHSFASAERTIVTHPSQPQRLTHTLQSVGGVR